jgi:hypothetical protein
MLLPISFRQGDPGKHVQGLIPTSTWKLLQDAARDQGITLGAAVQQAVTHWALRGGRL